jgi:RimJ/RimL family protein N-acetyltransferase
MSRFAEIRTERLYLTAISMADLDDFHTLHSNPDVYQHTPLGRHPDRAYSESVIETFVDDWARWHLGYWSVRLPDTADYIGCAGVRRNEVNWNVYYRFAPRVWGHGYAAEVIRAAGPFAEAIEPGAVLQAVMRPWNEASQRVAERLKMTFCGKQLDYEGIDELVYQIQAADLR